MLANIKKIIGPFTCLDLVSSASLKIIRNSIRGRAGIYIFRCRVTGMVYIGSASNLWRRFMLHLLGTLSNKGLQGAIKIHGISNFTFSVLEYVGVSDLLVAEQRRMNSFPPKLLFNVVPVGIVPSRLGATNSPEHNAAISESMVGNTNCLGVVHSAETKAAMSADG